MRLYVMLFILVTGACLAAAPNYDPFYLLQEGTTNIDCGYYGSPCVADWNGDGVKDLIFGIFASGNIWYFENVNTNSDPVFSSHSVLKADGSNITLPYG